VNKRNIDNTEIQL